MYRKTIVSVNRYEAIMGLCGIAHSVEEAAIRIPTVHENAEIDAVQRLAMGAKVLGSVVHAAEMQEDNPLLTVIYEEDLAILKKALFYNGKASAAVEARNLAATVLNRLTAEIAEQEHGQQEDNGLPPGFVVPQILNA